MNELERAVLNLPDIPPLTPSIAAEFKLGPNQTRWLELLEANPPKTRGRLKDEFGCCCLGVWLDNQEDVKQRREKVNNCNITLFSRGADEVNCFLFRRDVKELGLHGVDGTFVDGITIIVEPKVCWAKDKGDIDSLALLNDDVFTQHKYTAAFIRRFPYVVFKEPR